jgi:DNA polymerase-3 subunit gamma/tau
MSYQVLARKWRPRTFASLVGQEHVVRALTHALTAQRLHHAYLFTGTRGVGKTTLARILAKALNCETGVTATPCGTCSACQEIDSGRFVDLLEVDAATNTRVDEMRQLLENAVYAPTRGRFKVYVIDEVHMLSNVGLQRHVEDPRRAAGAREVHSRDHRPAEDSGHRAFPLPAVQSQADDAAADRQPSQADSSKSRRSAPKRVRCSCSRARRRAACAMRCRCSIRRSRMVRARVEEAQVREMLGAVDLDHLFRFSMPCWPATRQRCCRSPTTWRRAACRSMPPCRNWQPVHSRADRPARAAGDRRRHAGASRVLESLPALDPEFVQLAYQIAVHGRQELPLAPDEQAGFIMTLLRLYTFRPELGGGCQVGGHWQPPAAPSRPSTKSLPLAGATRRRRLPCRGLACCVASGASASAATGADAPSGRGPGSPASDWHEMLAALKIERHGA